MQMWIRTRKAVCWLMIAALPSSLLVASDTPAAMPYAKGTTWLNGAVVPHSSAIFPGDMVQTNNDALANINAPGSNVVVLPNSVLKYEGSAVSIERGGVTVATSKQLNTNVGEITVRPAASSKPTEFEVTDKGNVVQIIARRGDLSINDGADTTMIVQGQQLEVDKKKKKKRGAAAMPTGSNPILTPKVAAIAGGAAGVGILISVIGGRGGCNPNPVSADNPSSSTCR